MTTTNLGMTLPTVGADTDNWGNELNSDLGLIDAFAGKLMPGAEATLSSSATTDIGGAASTAVSITGTATITSFGTVTNCIRFVRFTGSLTLTYNATSLILLGGGNRTTAAGAVGIYRSDGSGNWRELAYFDQDVSSKASPAFSGLNLFGQVNSFYSGGYAFRGRGFDDFGTAYGLRTSGFGGEVGYSVGISFSSGWQFNINSSGSTGVGLATGSNSWSALSDADTKNIDNEIGTLPGELCALQKVATLRGCRGRYKTDEPAVSRVFLIAQDVQKVLPEAVSVENGDQANGWFGEPVPGLLSLRYDDMIPLLVAALKEQSAINDDISARLDTLESRQS